MEDVAADQIVVNILCSAEEAKKIVVLVEREYPTAAGEISVKPEPGD